MGLIDQLTDKPWLTEGDQPDVLAGRVTPVLPTPQAGLKIFLAVASVLFTMFMVIYAERMTLGDWRVMPEPWLMWVNTVLLILGSIGMQQARKSADRGHVEPMKIGLLAGGGCAALFFVGQVLVWQNLMAMGYYATGNPANAFFYVITALHGLHLLGGLVAWGRTAHRVWGPEEHHLNKVRVSVELCTVYWHFLLAVWVVMFSLLLLT